MHTRQVDEVELSAIRQRNLANLLLHGDPGIVGDLLAETGQLIEERGLARVGRPDKRDERCLGGFLGGVLLSQWRSLAARELQASARVPELSEEAHTQTRGCLLAKR